MTCDQDFFPASCAGKTTPERSQVKENGNLSNKVEALSISFRRVSEVPKEMGVRCGRSGSGHPSVFFLSFHCFLHFRLQDVILIYNSAACN